MYYDQMILTLQLELSFNSNFKARKYLLLLFYLTLTNKVLKQKMLSRTYCLENYNN